MKHKILIPIISALFLSSCANGPSWFSNKKTDLPGERFSLNTSSTQDASKSRNKIAVATNASNFTLGEELTEYRRVSLTNSNVFPFLYPPVIQNGVLYYVDAEGKVIAYNIEKDEMLWENSNVLAESFDGEVVGGVTISDGILYATFGVDVVAALDVVSGDVKWKTNLSFAVRSKPVLHKDKVIVLTIENALIALNKSTGEVSWQNPAIESDANLLAPIEATIVGDSLCYVSSGEVVCDEAESGMNVWSSSFSKVPNKLRTETGFYTDSNSVTHLANKEVIVTTSRGIVSLINAGNGEVKWLKNYNLSSKPAISGNIIAFTVKNSQLTLVDKSNGLEFWNADLKALNKDDNTTHKWGKPLLVGNMVILISNEGQLAAFELETGKLLKKLSVPSDISVQPEIIGDKLILISNTGYIYIY